MVRSNKWIKKVLDYGELTTKAEEKLQYHFERALDIEVKLGSNQK